MSSGKGLLDPPYMGGVDRPVRQAILTKGGICRLIRLLLRPLDLRSKFCELHAARAVES
jgi:hypothetical protein